MIEETKSKWKYLFLHRNPSHVTHAAGCEWKRYLEALQEAAVALVTSVSHGREAVHHRHSKCLGDGNLWESHTLCHCSDTCDHIEGRSCR